MQFEPNDIVLYPTDTLYGLGVDATNPEMVQKLKELKGRAPTPVFSSHSGALAEQAMKKQVWGRGSEKHFSIAVSDVEMLRQYAVVTPLAERLITAFLPGKLTLILIPNVQSPGSGHLMLARELGIDTGEIGVRIPAHEGTLAMIRAFGKPITATSANVSGMVPEKTPKEILQQFGERAALITKVIDEGELPPSEPSTVVDARGTLPIVIRPGAVSEVAISEALR